MAITSHFYHGSTRKIIVAMGTLFNGMEVHREDGKVISVPLTYASKEKFYLTMKQNYKLDKMTSMVLPRMGFMITDVAYDFERKQSSIGKAHAISTDNQQHKRMYLPVPYDISIQLSIYSRNMSDGLQLLEQILPMWKPSFNITINELEEMGVIRDIPIILDGVSHDDTSENDVSDGFRMLRWDLDFTVKANFYGPVKEAKVIKHVYIDFRTSTDGEYVEDVDERYYVGVDPPDAIITDLWEYNEELFSIEDDKLPVEIDLVRRNHDAWFGMSDYCEATVT